MTTCERCYKPLAEGDHGLGVCPFEPRKANAVIGDECDVWVKNGLCNSDGSPRRFTSKAEMAREAAARGLTPFVRHVDGSKQTSRWV